MGTYNEFKAKKMGPFRILKKIEDNACGVDLPTDLKISSTFNVANILGKKIYNFCTGLKISNSFSLIGDSNLGHKNHRIESPI